MNNSLLSRDPNNKPLIKFHAYKYDLSSYFESVRWFVRSPESRLKLAQTSVKFVAFRRNFSRNFKNPLFPSLSSPRCQLEIIFSSRRGTMTSTEPVDKILRGGILLLISRGSLDACSTHEIYTKRCFVAVYFSRIIPRHLSMIQSRRGAYNNAPIRQFYRS